MAGGVRGFGEDAADGVTEHGLEAERNTAGASAHPARQVHDERRILTHVHLRRLQLPGESPGRDRVPEEE